MTSDGKDLNGGGNLLAASMRQVFEESGEDSAEELAQHQEAVEADVRKALDGKPTNQPSAPRDGTAEAA